MHIEQRADVVAPVAFPVGWANGSSSTSCTTRAARSTTTSPTSWSGCGPSPSTSSSSSTAQLTAGGPQRLEGVADTVWERENVGFDVWGYKDALEQFGAERLAEYDELILMNYTWFGPVRPFEPVFERMDARAVDFWGMTDHGEEIPEPVHPTRACCIATSSRTGSPCVESMFLSDAVARLLATTCR